MIEAKFFTVGTYLYKYNLTVLFVSPSKIAHEKFYIYCPPLLLNEIYAHDGIPPVSSLLASSASPGSQWRLPIAFSLPLGPAGSAEVGLCSARCRSELLSGGLCHMADFWD